jgi:hypothetical protein
MSLPFSELIPGNVFQFIPEHLPDHFVGDCDSEVAFVKTDSNSYKRIHKGEGTTDEAWACVEEVSGQNNIPKEKIHSIKVKIINHEKTH